MQQFVERERQINSGRPLNRQTEAQLLQNGFGAVSRAVGSKVQHACANCHWLDHAIGQDPLRSSMYHSMQACIRAGGGMADESTHEATEKQRELDGLLLAQSRSQQSNGRVIATRQLRITDGNGAGQAAAALVEKKEHL